LIVVATSTAATASSASSAHGEREEKSLFADVTIGLLPFADVTIGLQSLLLADVTIGLQSPFYQLMLSKGFNL
jgi:hypothetical protein